jgi:hypothetical protein
MSNETRIDWGAAEVDGGRLTVPFTGRPSPDFRSQLADVIARLRRGGGWGEIKVRKSKLRVADVEDGAESELRHFLESAVLQANANVAGGEEDDDQPASGAERSEGDERMTEVFRGFAS